MSLNVSHGQSQILIDPGRQPQMKTIKDWFERERKKQGGKIITESLTNMDGVAME